MSTPEGVTRRSCSLGRFMTNESGEDLGATISIRASISSFVWGATGEVVVSDEFTASVDVGEEVVVDLIPTDLDGWLLNGVPIDVTEGKQSHYYSVTIQPTRAPQAAGTPPAVGPKIVYQKVAVPDGAGTFDIDKTTTLVNVSGQTVIIPTAALAIPAGGDPGQVLIKASDDDYDTAWSAASSGSGGVTGIGITEIRALTQVEYDALPVKVSTTLYVING